MKLPRTIELPMWAGYRAGARAKASFGQIKVAHHGSRVTDRQHEALAATEARAATMRPTVLDAIVKGYSTLRQWKPRPKTMSKAQLKPHVELWEVILTTDHHDGVGYVSYVFSCSWDPSGIYVLTHGDRVVSVGGSEVLEYPHADPMRVSRAPRGPTAAQRRAAIARAAKRARKNPAVLPAASDDEVWITLPVWAGFHAGGNAKVASGEVGVSIGGDAMGAEETTAEQQAAYRLVVKGQAKNQRLVLDAIASELPELSRGTDLVLPAKNERAALADLVSLTSVHLHWEHKGKLAYVGYELSCAWDSEHGVGVMTHDDRVVAVGQADTAILGWIATRDRKKTTPKKRRTT
jgi:hypothetical protein